MISLKIKKLDEAAIVPTKANIDDAGFDLYALEDAILGSRPIKVKTGIAAEIPTGMMGLISNRSSLGSKGIQVYGGVIDAGYRGELMVMMAVNDGGPIQVKKGDKIAQLVIYPIPTLSIDLVDSLSDSERGNNGFGSSGR